MLVHLYNGICAKAPWLIWIAVLVKSTLLCSGMIIPSIPEHSAVRIIWPKFWGSSILSKINKQKFNEVFEKSGICLYNLPLK